MLALPEKTRAALWMRTIDAKCANQLALATHLAPDDPSLTALRGASQGRKPHKEAVCAKVFWAIASRALGETDFARDRERAGLNSLLNYGYAVLLSTILQKLFAVGLDPTFGLSHATRERSTPLAYDLMEPFRPCVDARVFQWAKTHPGPWEVTREFRQWVTAFPLVRVEWLEVTLEIRGVIEGVIRGFRKAILEDRPTLYRPWTSKNSKWAGS